MVRIEVYIFMYFIIPLICMARFENVLCPVFPHLLQDFFWEIFLSHLMSCSNKMELFSISQFHKDDF